MIYVFIAGGLIIGVVLGIMSPMEISPIYAKYTSVALLAALDSVFGGTRAALERVFNLSIFLTGFFSNSLLAALLVFLGNLVGIDLYYVALISFGLRLFQNTAAIRRLILSRRTK
ncbi:MAG: small basic family protein [Veillonella sp.]|uniref:small basic family protein n=1 Tax=Veillonella sp. TaxID=1926307 RepID=UPI0025E8F0DF|nr:small basic family protein [Veillonella sp.]MBS4913756.1 small basic family protein [Veillonella sp.]